MRYEELNSLIESIDIPYAYRSFPKDTAKEPPYIVFFYDGNNDFFADNINYQTIVNLRIELYTTNKDFELEEALEEVLKEYEIGFGKEEVYIDSEEMYEIIYESEVVIDG